MSEKMVRVYLEIWAWVDEDTPKEGIRDAVYDYIKENFENIDFDHEIHEIYDKTGLIYDIEEDLEVKKLKQDYGLED